MSSVSEWKNRPPPSDCNLYQTPVQLSDIEITIPGLEFVSVAIGDGNERSVTIEEIRKYNIYFGGNKSKRRYCEQYDNGSLKIEANALRISFEDIPPRSLISPHYNQFCRQPSSSGSVFCPADPKQPIIDVLSFYVDGKYNARRMLHTWPISPDKTKEEIIRSRKPPLDNGLYEIDRNYFWFANNSWTTPDGSPFAMSCSAQQEKFHCETTYRVKGNLFTQYRFSVSKKTPVADARIIYDKAQSIISSLLKE